MEFANFQELHRSYDFTNEKGVSLVWDHLIRLFNKYCRGKYAAWSFKKLELLEENKCARKFVQCLEQVSLLSMFLMDVTNLPLGNE